jgi:hypothetical protein
MNDHTRQMLAFSDRSGRLKKTLRAIVENRRGNGLWQEILAADSHGLFSE